MANNQINVIDQTAFSSITHLETLDLSQNHLDEKSIAKQAFSHLSHLRNLKIFFGNSITTRVTNAEFEMRYFGFNYE